MEGFSWCSHQEPQTSFYSNRRAGGSAAHILYRTLAALRFLFAAGDAAALFTDGFVWAALVRVIRL